MCIFFALCRLPYRVARPNMSMSVFSCTVRSSSLKVSRPNCGRPDLASTSKANLSPTTRYCVSQHPTSETLFQLPMATAQNCRPMLPEALSFN